MVGYFLILLLITFCGLLVQKYGGNSKKIYVCLVFGAMFLYAALRGEAVGIDNTHRYQYVRQIIDLDFRELLNFIKVGDDEAGYPFTIWLITRLFPSPHFVGMVWDAFVTFSFAYFFYKYSKDIVITGVFYAAFAFASEMNITRQFIAAAIFLWIIQLVLQKRYIFSLILLAIAISFHTSAWILVVIYVLAFIDFKITRKTFWLLIAGAFAMFLVFDKIAELFVTFFPQYSGYIIRDWAVGEEEFSVVWLLIYAALAFMMYFSLEKKSGKRAMLEDQPSVIAIEENKIKATVVVFYILYATTGLLKSQIWFVGRMNVYFLFAYCMAVPYAFKALSFVDKRFLFLIRAGFILAMLVWAVSMFQQNGHGILPYVFFFD